LIPLPSRGRVLRGDSGSTATGVLMERRILLVAVYAVVIAASIARADTRRPILLESHVGPPPKDARYFIDYMVRTMGADAPLAGEELRRRIENSLSRTAGSPERPKNIRHLVEDGRRLFIEGEFLSAVAQLEQAHETLMSKVALVASDQTLRDALHKALLVTAHSYLRLKQPDRATELVSQVIRSYPDRDLSMVQYSPELVGFYKKVRRELDRQPRGTLMVTTRPEKCLVFLNERFVGLSPVKAVDLYPGRYRVFVQRPREPGRIHLANVNGGDHQITIDFELDRLLKTEPFVGLSFKSRQAQTQGEPRYAAALARALDAPMAIVLGFRRYRGRRVIEGTAISADTGVIRSGMVALEPAAPSPDTLKALGLFLVSGKPGIGIIVGDGPGGAPPAGAPDDSGGGFFSAKVFKWITLGIAVAGLGAGIALIAIDGRGNCDVAQGGLCPESYQTMTPGIILTVAGGAAAVGSGVLFYLDARGSKKVGVLPWLGPRHAGLGAVLSF